MAADHYALAQERMSHWSQQHDGYDPSRSGLVTGWLRAMHALAALPTRAGVPPTVMTASGIGAACLAMSTADSGPPATASAGLVLLTAVFDGLDGAVARRRADDGHPSNPRGDAIDHAADRITDVLFAATLSRAGASKRAATGAAAATLGYEAVRSLARRRGRVDALVTVGERPVRVVVVMAGLMAAPEVGAAIVAVLASVAVAQTWRHGRDRRR